MLLLDVVKRWFSLSLACVCVCVCVIEREPDRERVCVCGEFVCIWTFSSVPYMRRQSYNFLCPPLLLALSVPLKRLKFDHRKKKIVRFWLGNLSVAKSEINWWLNNVFAVLFCNSRGKMFHFWHTKAFFKINLWIHIGFPMRIIFLSTRDKLSQLEVCIFPIVNYIKFLSNKMIVNAFNGKCTLFSFKLD